MKKFYFWSILILFILALLPAGLWAQNDTQRSASDSQPNTHVTATQAMEVGYTFMRTSNGTRGGGLQSSNVRRQNMQLIYTGRVTDTLTRAITDCYYVFALQPKGFVIVAADNRVEPILGYSYDNNFVVEDMPEHIKGWLNDYEKQIEVVTKSAHPAEADIQTKWTRLESGQPLSNTRNDITVGPLLTTTWDQETFYNALCPEDPNGPDGHVVTGCVATAMAQLINYWGYPEHGRGTIHGDGFTNYYDGISSYYYEFSINLDTVTYDYLNMPVSLSANSSLSEINAVAKLMFHCGASVLMDYGPYASGTSDLHIRSALVSQFRYSPHTGLADRNQYTETEWNNLLRSEIAVGQPVLYCGADGSTGHCFVCDGYDNNDYFHFNFGWSGNGDGWYLTSAVNPGSYAFNSSQSVIIGVVPDSLSNVLYSSAGYMEYTIDSTFVFGDQLDNNPFRCWKNPASTNWYTLGYNVVTFRPADTTKQLILEILSFNNHYIDVYDGTAYDSTLRWFNENGNNSGLQPILSTRHALNLEVGYRQRSEQGFRFRISCEDMYPCRWVTNIVPTADTTAIHLHWNEVGDASQWQIEYGLKGFSHGEGTMVIAQDTTTSLTGLLPLKEYDIYIRPMCDTNLFGVWSPVITVRTLALGYWKDQVLSQPEGYVEDSLGNAYISSAEGLTWFYKLAKDGAYSYSNYFFSGRKAVLTDDIDLSGYIWVPIPRFYGTFDGQGHIINNMYSTEGLFGSLIDAEIKNVNLINIYGKRGLIEAANYSVTIMNCFVSGVMDAGAGADAGAIVSSARSGTHVHIINCASNCKVSGKTTGGIVGCGRSGSRSERSVIVRNCYSASTIKSTSSWQGSILGYAEDAETENCYAYKVRNWNLLFNGGGVGSIGRDNSLFDETDSGFYLLQPIYFETDSLYYSNLTEALNAGVRKYNLEGLRLWVNDTAGVNEGMPLLGPEYVVTCPNIQNFAAKNIMGANGEYGLELSWDEMGNATTWEIEYHEANSPNRVRIMTISNPDTLWGLTEQTTYVFRVRPICGTSNIGGWSEVYSHVFDRPYWTEIVTSQPDGYDIDSEGNVVISTAEALAWLISTVNGLNGQTSNDFHGKKIMLTQNINIGQFRWTTINNLLGTFDGKGNTIRGLYINELSSDQGLFGFVSCGTFINVKLDSANVKGNAAVGILVGQASYSNFINCHVSGTVYGRDYVGGMAGLVSNNSQVNACSSDGIVQAENDAAGGLIGSMGGIVRNSCSRCAVIGGRYTSGGLIGTVGSVVENCYATGNVSGYFYNGGLTGSFAGEMRNCYAGGTVPGRADVCMGMGGGDNIVCGYRKGALIGTRGTANVSNCYGLADFSQHPLVGISEYGDPIVIYDTASFTVLNDSILLLNSVAVSQNYYDNILDALNAWVDTYDTTGIFLHWVEDTAGINGGFPMFEEMKYNTLTLTVADSTPYGTVNGSGTYNHISSAVITATADRGYRFVQWNDGNTDNPRTVRITQDTTLVAIFEKGMFSVVGTPGTGLNYSFDFEDPARDLMWTLQNGDYGNQWHITTLDDTNRALFISYDNGISNYYIEKQSENSAYTTLLLTQGQYNYSYDYLCRSIYAGVQVLFCPASEQLPYYTWPLSNGIIPLGSHNGNSMEWISHSGQVNVPSTGEYFVWVHWQSVRNGRAKRDAPAIDNIQFNQISTEDNFHGYVVGSDTVPYLDSVVLIAVPSEDYLFSRWHDGNTDNPRTVVADADKYYMAIFECIPSFGSDSIFAFDEYLWGDSIYTVSTALHETLSSYKGCDSIVTHNLTIYELKSRYVTLHVADSTPYGTVSGEGPYSGYFDITATISATPDYGYDFISWNDGNSDNPRTITLTQDTTITAVFGKSLFSIVGTPEKDIDYGFDFENSTQDKQWTFLNKNYYNRWFITTLDDTNRALIISDNYYGRSNTYQTWSTSCVYAYTTLSLAPGQYNFSFDWRCNGHPSHYMRVVLLPASYELNDNEWSSYLSLPSDAITLHSQSFYLNSDFEWTNTSGVLSVNNGGDYKLVVHWYNDGSTSAGGSGSAAIDNIHFYYNTEEEYDHGYVLGSDTVLYLDSVVLTAIPYEGYYFSQWHDGNTDNPRAVVADANKYYVAMFECAPSTNSDSIIVCDRYLWNDSVYTISTQLVDTLTNFRGCDSIVTHQLVVNYSIIGSADAIVEYNFDFENAEQNDQWTFKNHTFINRWNINTLDNSNHALFVSNDNGISNNYTAESSTIYAYTTITLDSGSYNYDYDWRCLGSYGYHYLRVALFPNILTSENYAFRNWNYYGIPEDAVAALDGSHQLIGQTTWTTYNGEVTIPSTGAYLMVFRWNCNIAYVTEAYNPPAAIDNVRFYHGSFVDESQGVVLGSDTVSYLDTVVLTAIPYEGYQFSQWHDGNTDNPRTVIADAHKYYQAVFERAFVISDSIVACDSYQWHSTVYTASTMLFDTLPATGGGDSIVAHYLMVNHPAHTAITEIACESYVWNHADGTTQTCTVSDDYTYSHIDANGCTQVDTLHLTIYHGTHNVTTVTECESYTWTEGTGTTYTESGVYTYAYTNNNGCPSEDTLYLTINQSTTGEITISACDGFEWYDSTYTESGDYMLRLSNMAGCDSVVTLHLTVNHPAHTAITESACESYVWTHADGTTQTYFVSGDYLYSHSDVNGCVQVDTLHLAIHHPSTSVDEQSACGPFTWINGETYTSSVFGPTYTLSNEAGCDSVVTLSLTMYHSDTTQFTVTACNSFVWGDSTYTETGDYAQTYEGSNGCLSVSIMHLTINYSDTTEESVTSCDSYLWHGNNYTESGDYTAYYTNAAGCYSMTTLHLTVNHSTVGESVATACENYEWHGIVYTESGDYDYTLTAANGCDSVVTLHLTVNEGVATEFTITTADSCYIWNGQSYCASGDYTQNFETVDGCDSVVTLHLTITVGVDDYDYSNSLIIYPNPTKDVVNVQLTMNNEQLDGMSIQVFDVYGRLLEVVNMADARGASLQTTQIDLSRYANGVYFIKAVSEGKVLAVRKVVKK